MLTSVLGLRSPFAHILNPRYLTLTLLPSDSDKSPAPPRSSPGTPTSPQDDEDPSPKALAAIALLSGTLGLAAMTAAQSLTGYALLLALFGPRGARSYLREFLRADVSRLAPEHVASRASMARDPRYAAFLALFAASGAALPEEVLKYLPVLWLQRRGKGQGHQQVVSKRAAVRAAAAASLGFALVELVAYVNAAAAVNAGPPLAVTLLERVVIGLPGHVAMAVLSASRGADADADAGAGADAEAGSSKKSPRSGWRGLLHAVAPSVAYHALFDFVLFASSAWVGGHVGWVHPEGARAIVGTLGACVCLQGVLYAHTARAWLGWGK